MKIRPFSPFKKFIAVLLILNWATLVDAGAQSAVYGLSSATAADTTKANTFSQTQTISNSTPQLKFTGTGTQTWSIGSDGTTTNSNWSIHQTGANVDVWQVGIYSGTTWYAAMLNGGVIGWVPGSTSATPDTGFSRIAANSVALGNGGAGDGSGTLKLAAILPGVLYSAAGTALPTCASGLKGQLAVVSDATSPTYMGAYSSGGGITAQVICSYNGTTYSWLTH